MSKVILKSSSSESIWDRMKALIDEFGPSNVFVSVPQVWAFLLGDERLSLVNVAFSTENQVVLAVSGAVEYRYSLEF